VTDHGRRRFLSASAAAAAASMLPPAIARALAIPARRTTGSISDVRHVVILMQENRSFDHYFGLMRGVRGFGDPRPLLFADGSPVWRQPAASIRGKLYKPRGMAADSTHVWPFPMDPRRHGEHLPGTDHGWSSGHLAWNQGRYNSWVTQKQDPLTMGYLRPDEVAYHHALANAFTICDANFASAMSDTAINRMYLFSGTADPRNRLSSRGNGPGIEERPKKNGYGWTTYPERLERAGVSWQLYQGGTGDPGDPTDNFTDNSLEFFAAYQVAEGADPNGALVRKGVTNRSLRQFRADVIADRLPAVSYVVAPFKYSEHPDASPSDGAIYIDRVLDALTANPDVWAGTVFIVNYDENDGLFDHIVPPMPPRSSQQGANGLLSASLQEGIDDEFLDLDRFPKAMNPLIPEADPGGEQPVGLGTRVPMIIVSPWTSGGWVCSQVFDHTSVLRFLEKRFGVAEPNISPWRKSICGDLTAAFDFAATPAPAPRLARPKALVTTKEPVVVRDGGLPKQPTGTRPSRALPYAFDVQMRRDGDRVLLDFSNTGDAGVAFYVYDRTRASDAPRRYALAADDRFTDHFDGPRHVLIVHGPNGFLREFRSEGDGPSISSTVDDMKLVLSIMPATSDTSMTLNVHEAYLDDGRKIALTDGAAQTFTWDLTPSHGWHDVSVSDDRGVIWRAAGRVESGRPGVSDPRIGVV
jgi:phospholipase C